MRGRLEIDAGIQRGTDKGRGRQSRGWLRRGPASHPRHPLAVVPSEQLGQRNLQHRVEGCWSASTAVTIAALAQTHQPAFPSLAPCTCTYSHTHAPAALGPSPALTQNQMPCTPLCTACSGKCACTQRRGRGKRAGVAFVLLHITSPHTMHPLAMRQSRATVTCLYTRCAPNRKASLSSVITPSTRPARSSQAHCIIVREGGGVQLIRTSC